jgi:hypothetical protein
LLGLWASPPLSAQTPERIVRPTASGSTINAPLVNPPLRIAHIHGRAFHIREHGVFDSLQMGDAVRAAQPLKVGPRSRLDVQVRDGGLLELGPGAQVVVSPPSSADGEGKSPTALRLDNGYLKITVSPQSQHARFAVAFGRWLAHVDGGEVAFETQGGDSIACLISGSMRITGAPDWSGSPPAGSCLRLNRQVPTLANVASESWARVQARRMLLAHVAPGRPFEPSEATPGVTASPGSPALASVLRPTQGAASVPPPVTANLATNDASYPPLPMPRVRSVPIAIPEPLPVSDLEAMERNVNRAVTRERERVAATLVSMAEAFPPGAGKPALPGLAPNAQAGAMTPSEAAGRATTSGARGSPARPPTAPVVSERSIDAKAPVASTSTRAQEAPPSHGGSPSVPADRARPEVSASSTSTSTSTSADVAAARTPVPSFDTPPIKAERPVEPLIAFAPGPVAPSEVPIPLAPRDADGDVAPSSEWIVNVQTYASSEAAEYVAAQLRERQILATVRPEIVRGRSSYRVVVEGLATEDDAKAVLRRVAENGARRAWILRKR